MFSLNTAEVKTRLVELINCVALKQERVVVLQDGKPIAALISIEDLERLEALNTALIQNENPQEHPIMQVFGVWADRTDLDDLVDEIYADRERTKGREITL